MGGTSSRAAEFRAWLQQSEQGEAIKLAALGRYHDSEELESKYELSGVILGTTTGANQKCGNGPVALARGRVGTPIQGKEFAVKTFRKREGEGLWRDKNEVMLMLTLDHPNIAKLEDIFDSPTQIHMVMERLGEELLARIVRLGHFTEGRAVEAVRSMCKAVRYLHSRTPQIVHRDLKPENFMYESGCSWHLKLIDFGISTRWDRRSSPGLRGMCGTTCYIAPEVRRCQQHEDSLYTDKCDIFALGVIAYILLTGAPPFEQSDEMEAYTPFEHPPFKRVSHDGQSFVQLLLSSDEGLRPSAKEALHHAWLREDVVAEGEPLDAAVLASMRRFSNASRFKRICLSMMAWSLTVEEMQELRRCFGVLDKNGDGRISLIEMRHALEDNFTINSTDAIELFKSIETGDGEIQYSDFLAIAMQERVLTHETVLLSAFARFDRNDKGYITCGDLRCMLEEDSTGVTAEEVLKELGKSGPHDRVSREEFMSYLTCEHFDKEERAQPEAAGAQPTAVRPELAPGTPQTAKWSMRRVDLAARLIDGQRGREQQEQGRLPLATFSPGTKCPRHMADPLEPKMDDQRQVKSFAC